jgi:hypothetical protein
VEENMSNEIYILGVVFAVYVALSIFYNYAARPMLCDRARFKIFALRDKLRRLAINGQISASSFEYKYLEALLCRLVEKCAWFSWSALFEFLWRKKDAELSPDAVRFEREASETVKDIYSDAVLEMMHVMCTNSPIWTLFMCIGAGVDHLFGLAWKRWLDIKAKIFLEEPIPETAILAV